MRVRESVRLLKVLFSLVLGVLPGFAPAGAALALNLVETPGLVDEVLAGKLPAVEARVPEEPFIVHFTPPKKAGRHGGDLRLLMGRAKDIRQVVVYGYARLVAYDENYRIVPDIVKSFSVRESRIFTFTLRKGHKWSDGHPFTVEDFRYYWQDMAIDKDISPLGPPKPCWSTASCRNLKFLMNIPCATAGMRPIRFFCRRWRAPTLCGFTARRII